MITKHVPKSWQALQQEVGRILEESGFSVEIEKTITASRGKVELDVYAEETVQGRAYSIAVECKHWKKRVPQTVIHSFRTVVSDIGANVGYIISLNGFQSGAFEAIDLTNLELATWDEFQAAFLESWYEGHFSPVIVEKLDGLMTYSEPFLPAWYESMTEEDKEKYHGYKQQYDVFGMVMQSFGPYTRLLRKDKIPSLPLIDRLTSGPERNTIPEGILKETHYRDFLDASLEHGLYALGQYRELRDKYAT